MSKMPIDSNNGREVEVHIEFDSEKIDRGKLHQIESLLLEMGIGFDTGGTVGWCNGGVRDWEWDWSLKGPVKVKFVRFVEDNPENRYNRPHLRETSSQTERGGKK